MYRFSFRISHRNCCETSLSAAFPKHDISVIDIQSSNKQEKQYLYHISGSEKEFDGISAHIRSSKGYKLVKEVERSGNTLLLLVTLRQKAYVQNIIQRHNGFLLDMHTVSGGWEYWHIGVIERTAIKKILDGLKKIGQVKIIYVGKADFSRALLSAQQKAVLIYAHKNGYYQIPRKITIKQIAKALKLSPATVGEHLIRAENKVVSSIMSRL